MFFETANAKVFNKTSSVIQNKTAESTMPADRSLIVKLLADNLEERSNKWRTNCICRSKWPKSR